MQKRDRGSSRCEDKKAKYQNQTQPSTFGIIKQNGWSIRWGENDETGFLRFNW